MPARQTAGQPRSARTRRPPAQQPPGKEPPARQPPARQRNPRGQGDRLRDDIIEAASRLLADPSAPPLTLRAVARAAGVAATSVYLHFENIESLVRAVADRRFGELVRRQDESRAQDADPCLRVRSGALAYCEFGMAYPGHYQVMFTSPLGLPDFAAPQQMPGWRPFQALIDSVAACLGPDASDQEAFVTATLIWQQLHGLVSLRISRPKFPWPPLAETVTDVVDRLLAGASIPAT